jgi:hypothetical protein
MEVRFDLDEASVAGMSNVEYQFINASAPTESASINLKYNDPNNPYQGIASQSNILAGVSAVYPNPSKNGSFININSGSENTVNVSVINSLGAVVSSKQVALNMGSNTIPTESEKLNAGIYYIKLSGNNQSTTRKFIVLK